MNRHPVRTNRGQAIFVEYRLALFVFFDSQEKRKYVRKKPLHVADG